MIHGHNVEWKCQAQKSTHEMNPFTWSSRIVQPKARNGLWLDLDVDPMGFQIVQLRFVHFTVYPLHLHQTHNRRTKTYMHGNSNTKSRVAVTVQRDTTGERHMRESPILGCFPLKLHGRFFYYPLNIFECLKYFTENQARTKNHSHGFSGSRTRKGSPRPTS